MKERDAESRLFQPLEGNCNNELKIDCKYVTWGGAGGSTGGSRLLANTPQGEGICDLFGHLILLHLSASGPTSFKPHGQPAEFSFCDGYVAPWRRSRDARLMKMHFLPASF